MASNLEGKQRGEHDPLYGLTDIEIKRFPMTSNRDPHPFIFARKAR